MPQLRLALAQVNPTVGDLAGNAEIVVDWSRRAADAGAHVVAFPEMMLTGYPIEDLAFRSSFVDASRATLEDVAARLAADGLGDLVVVVGYLGKALESADRLGVPKGSPQNCAAFLHDGRVVSRYSKHHLPNYGVFDEARYFVPGDTIEVAQVHGVDIALCICEDLWQDGPSAAAKAAEAGLLLVVNGSPYEANKDDVRRELCSRRAVEAGAALAYVNMVGGQDELVFDGDSLVVDAAGEVVARAAQFTEELLLTDLDLPAATPDMPSRVSESVSSSTGGGLNIHRSVISSDPVPAYDARPGVVADRIHDHGEIYQALVVGLRDYVHKNGFSSVLLGMSGGIDSTLVAAIACDALGAANVYGVSNPSEWSSEHSRTDAADQAAPHRSEPAHGAHRADGRRVPGRPEARRPGAGEPAGPHPRGDLDGPVQPGGPPGARLRQQERARGRLLDDLRRRRRGVRADQGRVQDPGVGAREVAQRRGRAAR